MRRGRSSRDARNRFHCRDDAGRATGPSGLAMTTGIESEIVVLSFYRAAKLHDVRSCSIGSRLAGCALAPFATLKRERDERKGNGGAALAYS